MEDAVKKYGQELTKCFETNKNAYFKGVERYGDFGSGCKFTGAVFTGEALIGIPNSGTAVLKVNPGFARTGQKPFELFDGDFEPEPFGYTGGAFYDEKVYALPRRANAILEIDPRRKTAVKIPLSIKYEYPEPLLFHHYAGVKAEKRIFCAPKASRKILVIDLTAVAGRRKENCYEIAVADIGRQEYHGGVPHPDGKVYFNPAAGSRVMALDPREDKVEFIGFLSPQTIFKSILMPEGKIYGFGYNGGVLITDVCEKSTRVVENSLADLQTYGAMLSFNGKFYSYIGTGTALSEFDPATETFRVVQTIDDGKFNYAKCAAGGLTPDGSIWQLPAFGRFVYRLVFKGIERELTPDFLREAYFSGY